MRRMIMMLSVVMFLMCTGFCTADRQLDRTEILGLFEKLTSQPRNTWIQAGTIQGRHEEYSAAKVTDEKQIREMISKNISKYRTNNNKPELTESLQKLQLDAIPMNTRYEMANEYTQSSVETVVYDGSRFKWEIDVEKRVDSVKPDKSLEGNYMSDQFNMKLNGRRIFAWDGQNYTMYTPLAEHALVDATSELPRSVDGPLTAGLLPWGYGYYSYKSLADLESEAFERIIDGKSEIFLTLINEDGSQFTFVLDPSMNYAVTNCFITGRGSISLSRYYSEFENVSGSWIPTSIVLEKIDENSGRLLSRDIWELSIDANVPEEESFIVECDEDTVIEYISPIENKHLIYKQSSMADTDILLGEKLSYDANKGARAQNCATASMKYALGQMGIYVSDSQLAALVEAPDNSTSLYAMKRFAQGLGLNCRAVKTDLDAVRNLGGCQIIFYFPGKKHFVAMESIDSDYVNIVDLTSRKFYYRADASFFDMDWSTGVALVISDRAIEGDLIDLDYEELHSTTGAVDGYDCTRLIQSYSIIYCQMVNEQCMGYYTIFWERWGCEAAESGSCSTSWLLRMSRSTCIENINDPGSCITSTTYNYYIQACQ